MPRLTQHLIVTVEQLFKSQEGHLPWLVILLCNSHFQHQVICIIVDEAHNIHFSGLSHYGLDAFWLAWGRLDEIKAILLQKTHWCACSATFTLLALQTVKNKVLHSNYVYIYVTSNRANTIYVAHQVVNSIDDLQNYLCFLMLLFHPTVQPCVLIFVDNKKHAACIASHLDSCLPPTIQNKGIIVHYHSKMSKKYLQNAHDSFIGEDGVCWIMVAMSAQSVVKS